MREVLARCEALRRATGGAFDARAGGALDPSGYVKGWALERAAALVDARELCLDGGGDLVLRGGPWRVGIRHPLRARPAVLGARASTSGAVATSATYERGEHILDPRTGRPPAACSRSPSPGPDLAVADAYATAAFAMGADGPAWTAGLGRLRGDDRARRRPRALHPPVCRAPSGRVACDRCGPSRRRRRYWLPLAAAVLCLLAASFGPPPLVAYALIMLRVRLLLRRRHGLAGARRRHRRHARLQAVAGRPPREGTAGTTTRV